MKRPSLILLGCLLSWLIGLAWPLVRPSLLGLGLFFVALSLLFMTPTKIIGLFALHYLLGSLYFFWFVDWLEPTGHLLFAPLAHSPPIAVVNNTINQARAAFLGAIDQTFHQPQAALLAGILAGLTTGFPKSLIAEFRVVGLSHVIAVSGFNLTIVMQLFTRLTAGLGRWLNGVLSWLIIIAFVVFCGASPSIVRAGIFASLFIIVRLLGRKVAMFRLVVYAAFLMSLQNPQLLRDDIGFQLSFGAVLGLVIFADGIDSWLVHWHWPGWLAEVIAATTAAQLTTWPIIAFHFQTFSLYGLPANLVVVPLVTWLTIIGWPYAILLSIWPKLAWVGFPFDLVLRFITWFVGWVSHWPHASLPVGHSLPVIWLIYYIVLISLAAWLKSDKSEPTNSFSRLAGSK